MLNILLYVEEPSPKLAYVLYNISEYLDLNFTISSDYEHFLRSNETKISYADVEFEGIKIPNSGYLSNFKLSEVPSFEKEFKLIGSQGNFDLFSAMFYLLARIEEYQSFVPDQHGRFTSSSSILVRKDLHRLPVIEHWLISFRNIIEFKFGKRLNILTSYNVLSTIDIDHIYAFKAKPLLHQSLSVLKDVITLNTERLKKRFSPQDPFDKFDWIDGVHQKLALLPIYFILCSKRSQYDKSLSPTNKAFIDRVKKLTHNACVGIHPSYNSNSSEERVLKEKNTLESIIEKSVYCSRQHYLRLNFPKTYKNLLSAGITNDYSMGFAQDIGFRAGTCRPYNWYDLQKDGVTNLKIIPFQVMDVTLNRYLGLSPEEAFEYCVDLIKAVKDVQGTFSIIWHNSSLDDFEGWKGWSDLYIKLLEYAVNK